MTWEIKHLSMAYIFSNISTNNYWNWTTAVKIIIGDWVVYFVGTQCKCESEAGSG